MSQARKKTIRTRHSHSQKRHPKSRVIIRRGNPLPEPKEGMLGIGLEEATEYPGTESKAVPLIDNNLEP